MNILFLMGVYPSYGGVEKVSTVLANAFVNNGHGVSIVSFEQPYPEVAKKELNTEVRLYKLDYPVYSKANVLRLHQILTDGSVDVIINQWCVPFYVARLCKHAMKGTACKLVSVHHNKPDTNARIKDIEIKIEKKQGNAWLNKLKLFVVRTVSRMSLRYTYNNSDCYVVLSPRFVPIARKYMWLGESAEIISIPNPLTITLPSKPIELERKKKQILCVGRIEYNQKRTFRIVEIWKRLEKSFPEWELIIVGDGPDRKDLEQRTVCLGLQHVKFTGFVDPVPYYETASLQVMASQYEGFLLVIVEGQSYGVVPLILGSYEAVYDIIDSERDGVISSLPYSEERMAKELSQLMENENLRVALATQGQKNAERYMLREIVSRWEMLFNELKE